MEKTYAKVLWKLSHQEGADLDALVTRLIEQLQTRGRMKLLPRILRELKKLEESSTESSALIEVATGKDALEALAFVKELGLPGIKDAKVNPSLISGWRVRANGGLTDRSGKRALIDIYRSITTHA
jgi:F0F1-type ATP synthase delta subunit